MDFWEEYGFNLMDSVNNLIIHKGQNLEHTISNEQYAIQLLDYPKYVLDDMELFDNYSSDLELYEQWLKNYYTTK